MLFLSSWLSLGLIGCIISGDVMNCYPFFFSYYPNLLVFFVQRDYVSFDMRVYGWQLSWRVLSDPSPLSHNLMESSPLAYGLAWWLASNKENAAKVMECPFCHWLLQDRESCLAGLLLYEGRISNITKYNMKRTISKLPCAGIWTIIKYDGHE